MDVKKAIAVGGCLGVTVAVLAAVGGQARTAAGQTRTAAGQAKTASQQNWVDLAVHNFGAPINTMWSEGELSFADDGTMVFTTSREDLAIAPGDPKDIYITTFNKETGKWNKPTNMGMPVNSAPATDVDPLRKGDDREPWISPDGKTIYFKSDRLATTNPRNLNDIFVTHKVNGVWSTPELVPFPISTDAGNEHCPMLLRDGKTLCFASERAGGYGSFDIWCSEQEANGKWRDPVNQGPNINTAASEFHFMEDRDAQWVYFTSTRPGGYGGADIWASRHLGPNNWGPAVNLGPKVNTPGADMCPALGPDGRTFYWFASRPDDSLGSTDIYWTNKSNLDLKTSSAGGSSAVKAPLKPGRAGSAEPPSETHGHEH